MGGKWNPWQSGSWNKTNGSTFHGPMLKRDWLMCTPKMVKHPYKGQSKNTLLYTYIHTPYKIPLKEDNLSTKDYNLWKRTDSIRKILRKRLQRTKKVILGPGVSSLQRTKGWVPSMQMIRGLFSWLTLSVLHCGISAAWVPHTSNKSWLDGILWYVLMWFWHTWIWGKV